MLGASWPRPRDGRSWPRAGETGRPPRAIDGNWIKLHPSCLGTHSPIDAAEQARSAGRRLNRETVTVRVHPRARQAAHLDAVGDGLSAKFSIPYCVAHTLIHGAPRVRDFASLDEAAGVGSRLVEVALDESLPEFGAVLAVAGRELTRMDCPRGAPGRPLTQAELAAKLADLAGDRLDGVLEDLNASAITALTAAGLRCSFS